jgi:hypothetical protein
MEFHFIQVKDEKPVDGEVVCGVKCLPKETFVV